MSEQPRADLVAAMKAKDEARLKVLRGALAALGRTEAAGRGGAPPGTSAMPRPAPTDADVRSVIDAERAELEAAAAELAANDRQDEADELRRRRAMLDRYL